MYVLPTLQATLARCPVSPAEFTAHPQGHFCGQCQRVVHDFTQLPAPRAALDAARAASVDGQVCGRFGAGQVGAAPRLSRRLRWFVAALVLVVSQGLTAREALAQCCAGTGGPVPVAASVSSTRPVPIAAPAARPTPAQAASLPADSTAAPENANLFFGVVIEPMPTFQHQPMQTVAAYIGHRIKWPAKAGRTCTGGRVFASFTVGADGWVRDVRIVKSLHPLFDAEVLRVIRALPRFEPGRQRGKPVAISWTMPVTFRWK